MPENTSLVPYEVIDNKILFIRNQKVMLDFHLAHLYEVPTGALNQAVKRNINRFPEDFMFQLTSEETELLRALLTNDQRSQFVIFKKVKSIKYLPYVFTEFGVAMLSSVLKSKRAIHVNIEIMRTFGRLREILARDKDLARKLAGLEKKYDYQFKIVFEAIDQLTEPPPENPKRIGFL